MQYPRPIHTETMMMESRAVWGDEIQRGGLAMPIERRISLIGPDEGLNIASQTTDTAVMDVI